MWSVYICTVHVYTCIYMYMFIMVPFAPIDLPVLSTLVVKDHYSMLSDKQCPTFVLRDTGSGSGREVWSWSHQLNQLFVHKMSEALRVLMCLRLLATGPDVERGSSDIYNKVSSKNLTTRCSYMYMYMHLYTEVINDKPH